MDKPSIVAGSIADWYEFRIFEITGSETDVTLDSLTIRNGRALSGGGILNDGGILTVRNSTIRDNIASGTASQSGGGGIFNNNGTLTVISSTIADNAASDAGSGGLGGGILSLNTLTVQDSTIRDNKAQDGGGMTIGGTGYLATSTLSGNVASGDGGGINHIGTLSMTNNTLSGNTADNGGGIYTVGIVHMTNGTLSDNIAISKGGGIYSGGELNLANSIVANNTSNDLENVSTLNASGTNMVETGVSGTGTVNGGSSISTNDPALSPLQDHGGPTLTHAPQAGSPAIDAGVNAVAIDSDSNPLLTDQRGFARISNGTVDIGAVEVQDTCFATANGGTTVERSIDAQALRAALVSVSSGGTVDVAGFCGGATENQAGVDNVVVISDQVTVQGGYPVDFASSTPDFDTVPDPATHETVLSGQDSGRVVYSDGNVTLRGLTIRRGSATSPSPGNLGGGIFNDGGVLRMERLTLSDNTAVNGGGLYNRGTLTATEVNVGGNSATNGGGGLYNDSVIVVQNSIFRDNSAVDEGGGLYDNGVPALSASVTDTTFMGNTANIGGALYNRSVRTLADTIISGNSANNGGGIYNNGTVTVQTSTLNGNTADNGGAIYNRSTMLVETSDLSGNRVSTDGAGISNDDTMTVASSTLRDNVAADDGGGIYHSGASLAVLNSTLSGNIAGDGGGIYNRQVPELLNHSSTGPIGSATNDAKSVQVIHSTISNNTANDGGGILNTGNIGMLSLANSIVAKNTNTDVENYGPLTAVGTNIVGTPISGFGTVIGAENIILDEPQLGPLQDNGGPTRTHLPDPATSPAIDAGNNDIVNGTTPLADFNRDGVIDSTDAVDSDQRSRNRVSRDTVDIGAVELQVTRYSIALSAETVTEGDSSLNTISVFITRSGNTSAASSVEVSPGGDAREGDDYTFTFAGTSGASFANGTLTFDAGTTEATLTIAVQDDGSVEPDETVTVTLANGRALEGVIFDITQATLTIMNDDSADTNNPDNAAGTTVYLPFVKK